MDSREKLSRFFLDENERSFNFGVPKDLKNKRSAFAVKATADKGSLKL
jgi:hypothetical protein